MALALVAQSAATVVFEKLINTALSYVGKCLDKQIAKPEEIQRLRQASQQIGTILAVVEGRQTVSAKQNDVLDAWLWQLRDALERTEDVLDEMEYYELEKAVQAGDNKVRQGTILNLPKKYFVDFTNNFIGNDLRNDTLERLREAVKALNNAAASSETFLQLVSQLYNPVAKRQQEIEIRNARETSSFLSDDMICGRHTERKRIVEWLTKPTVDDPENSSATVIKVSAFAIVGMGGMGKTTLAQFVYHDEKVQQCFDLVMWVCVSDQFDVNVLTRKILEAAEVRDSLDNKSLNTIQEILKKKLITNKFLLVLDDVWNDEKILEWNKLVGPLKFGKNGSKILLTTRLDSVAETVKSVLQCKKEESLKLSGLKKDDVMRLFNKHAFAGENIDDHRNLKLIGEQIAMKLGGCPLAAKILGGCLNSSMNKKYWRRILNENFLNLQESEDNIRMILRLSYHHLPASLQICFRYCSIFPKDHEFEKNGLINMWIGSGLIKKPTHEKRSLEDIGEEYLNHLARKSLFDIKIIEEDSYRKQSYIMHDLLHDLAQFVSSGECLGIEGDGSRDIPKTIRHIYVKRVNLRTISHLKNLRTLIIHLNKDYDAAEFNEVLKGLKSLHLLRVTAGECKLPDEVGNLIHLRYLSLSMGLIKENERSFLLQSVCRLHHLEVMKLEITRITEIDDSTLDGMSNLVKLRLLDIPHDKMDKIPWIGKLTSLQELQNFRVRGELAYKIDQLKDLQNLRILCIKDLENIESSGEAEDANLNEKKNLDKLSLFWSTDRYGGQEVDELHLEKLSPHTDLKELTIDGYAGVGSPKWMTVTSLSNITSISLSNCERWENLLPFGQLPLLKFLNLANMRAVKTLLCSGRVGGCAFPSLQELQLHDMPNLELFKGEHMFPLLNKLVIMYCPSLEGLPALPLTLNKLEIHAVRLTSLPMMQQDCSSSEGRASCSSSSHPALASLVICDCPNLTSLDGFIFQQQYFPALENLYIQDCENLRHLPEKFFQKLPSLRSLIIEMCPNLTTHGIIDNQFPKTLESLVRGPNGDLNLPLLETALEYMKINSCANMTSLPLAEVFPRLSKLHIWNCKELSSLDGLQALPSLRSLYIGECDKLIKLSLLQPPLGLTSTSHTDMVLRPSMELVIDRQSLLRLEPLRNLNSVTSLSIYDGTELTSLDEQWLLQNRNSLQSFVIFKASSLKSLPASLIDLRFLVALEIDSAPSLQSIPKLPTSLEFLKISGCHPELKVYIEGSKEFANIPVRDVTEEDLFLRELSRWENGVQIK